MAHPFEQIRPELRVRLAWSFGAAGLLLGALINWLGSRLQAPDGRPGGMALQLAGAPSVVAWIVSAWTVPQRALQQNLLILDYGFLILYGVFLSLACLWASALWPKGVARQVGVLVAWAQWAAAAFDAIENAALLTILRPTLDPAAPVAPDALIVTLGWVSTMLKWTLIEAGLIYIALSALFDVIVNSWARTVRASLDR